MNSKDSARARNAGRPLIVIQRNPTSGTGRGRREIHRLITELHKLGYHVRLFASRTRLDAYLSQSRASDSLIGIVAAGGDGTVADLVNRHPGVPLAVLPLGTENLLARYLGLRRCGRTLSRIIHRRHLKTLDTAMADGRRFLLMLSVGVDADIVNRVHAARSGNISRLRYLGPVIREFLWGIPGQFLVESVSASGLESVTAVLSDDGSIQTSGGHVIATNIPKYGFDFRFAPQAVPDDGLLDVRVCHAVGRWCVLWHAIRLRLGLPIMPREVTRFRAASLSLRTTADGMHGVTQCDGDPGPPLPAEIRVQPRTLHVFVA